jgi:hypothetical protein
MRIELRIGRKIEVNPPAHFLFAFADRLSRSSARSRRRTAPHTGPYQAGAQVLRRGKNRQTGVFLAIWQFLQLMQVCVI